MLKKYVVVVVALVHLFPLSDKTLKELAAMDLIMNQSHTSQIRVSGEIETGERATIQMLIEFVA